MRTAILIIGAIGAYYFINMMNSNSITDNENSYLSQRHEEFNRKNRRTNTTLGGNRTNTRNFQRLNPRRKDLGETSFRPINPFRDDQDYFNDLMSSGETAYL